MILTARDIAEITRLLDESHFSELRLEIGEFKLRISRGGAGARGDFEDDDEPAAAPAPPAPAASAGSGGPAKGEVDVPSPLLGNFYHSPRPGDPPFVEPGDRVGEDTTIGIVEVMKLMNPIRAGVAGTVVAYLAQNGTAVEKDQPLIRVKVG
jgi:acetyl-CoA carboxylase biotin carboxyl carrier protein